MMQQWHRCCVWVVSSSRKESQAVVLLAKNCLAGQGELVSDLGDFLKSLDESQDRRAAATLRVLSRVLEELERVTEMPSFQIQSS